MRRRTDEGSDMERKFLKPAVPGLKVRDPKSYALLPDDGAEKEMNTYWRRRIACGDVKVIPVGVCKETKKGTEK